MILETAIAEVQQICGWRSDRVAEITRALQYAQDEREKPGMTFPWWLKVVNTSLVTIINTRTYTLPVDFIQEAELPEGILYLNYGTGINIKKKFLKRMDFVDAENYYSSGGVYDTGSIPAAQGPGAPAAYTIGSTTYNIYPFPNAVYSLTWAYWGKAAALALGQANLWLTNAPWVLVGDAAMKIASDMTNADALATATKVRDTAVANMFRSAVAREDTGRKRYMGSRL